MAHHRFGQMLGRELVCTGAGPGEQRPPPTSGAHHLLSELEHQGTGTCLTTRGGTLGKHRAVLHRNPASCALLFSQTLAGAPQRSVERAGLPQNVLLADAWSFSTARRHGF